MASRVTNFGVNVALVVVAWAGTTDGAMAQTLTRAMVESHLKEWVAAAFANNPEAIVRLDPAANDFGYRQLKARSADVPVSTQLDTVKAFLASVDYLPRYPG